MSEPLPIALLVEDEPQIRRFVRMALEGEGWQVFESESMKRGLIDAGTRKPNLIVLDAGADDYLIKPFGVGELLARVRATLRRQRQPDTANNGIAQFGDVRVDLYARLVTKAGQPVHLTPTEYRLLTVLIANAGRVITNRQLLREVWGPSNVENGHYLRVYMGHLRQKLEDDPTQPAWLLTETAVGYRLFTG